MVTELFYYWLGSGLGSAVDVMQGSRDPPIGSFFKFFFIILLQKDDWWQGRCRDKVGWFPGKNSSIL